MKETANLSKPELLAPAGDFISLRSALQAGCDAVYFGVQGLNMRAGAENFTLPHIKTVVGRCRDYSSKAYLALNTIVYEHELGSVKKILSTAKNAGVDAVICWDFAVIQEALKAGIPVHVSTQMSIANSAGIRFFVERLGIRRFVLARECSLDDIKKLNRRFRAPDGRSDKTAVELEIFAHGAMCVSVSGRCFLSQFQYGKSANRGQCLQPCRREYEITAQDDDASFIMGSDYLLSPRDICTLPFIEKLIEAGAASFKIEGRNRSPEYVYTVTSAYRRAIDFYYDNRHGKGFSEAFSMLKKNLTDELKQVYNRGFSSGFYLGKPLSQWAEAPGSAATARKVYAGAVTNYYKRIGVAEIRLESRGIKKGDELLFQGSSTGNYAQAAQSLEIDHQKVAHADKGRSVAVKVSSPVRTGDRVYVIEQVLPAADQ